MVAFYKPSGNTSKSTESESEELIRDKPKKKAGKFMTIIHLYKGSPMVIMLRNNTIIL